MIFLFLLLPLLLLSTPVAAGVPCSLPFNLQNGQPADATQVMANYNALVTCLGSAAAAGANSDITSITGLLTPLPPNQGGTPVFLGVNSTGTNAQVVVTTTPSNFSLTQNYMVLFIAGASNTGPATLAVNSTGAIAVNKQTIVGKQALVGGEIVAGQIYAALYDGSVFQLLNPTASSSVLAPSVITGAYTVQASDCGKVLSLAGGNVFYAVTLNAPSGYANGCTVTLADAPTEGRGKGIAVSGGTSRRLLPLQSVTYIQNGGAWQASPVSELWQNLLGQQFYVNHLGGSDNPLLSDCLASGVGACSTFQGAVDLVHKYVYPNVGGINIQADCEAAYGQAALNPTPSIGIQVYRDITSIINFAGNVSTPTNCQLTPSSTLPGSAILDVQDGAQVTITGFLFGYNGGASGTAVNARQLAILDVNNSVFASNGGGVQVSATNLSSVNLTTVTLNGNAAVFVNASSKATVQVNSISVGTATFSTAWIDAADAEVAGNPAWSVTGAAGGVQYACALNAVINFGAVAYPVGTTVGSSNTGCQHAP